MFGELHICLIFNAFLEACFVLRVSVCQCDSCQVALLEHFRSKSVLSFAFWEFPALVSVNLLTVCCFKALKKKKEKKEKEMKTDVERSLFTPCSVCVTVLTLLRGYTLLLHHQNT